MFVVNSGQIQRQNAWTDAQVDYHRVPTGTIFFLFLKKNTRMEGQMRGWIVKMQIYNLIPNLINKKFTAHCFIFADTNFLWHSETARAFYNNAENIKRSDTVFGCFLWRNEVLKKYFDSVLSKVLINSISQCWPLEINYFVLWTFSYVMTYSRYEISDRPVQLKSDVCLLWNLSTKIKKRRCSDLQQVWLKLNARHQNRCALYIWCFQPLNQRM